MISKKSILWILLTIAVFAGGFYIAMKPKSLAAVVGENVSFSSEAHIKMDFFYEQRTKVESLQSDDYEKAISIIDFFNKHKYVRVPIYNGADLLKNDSYNIYVTSNKKNILELTVIDNRRLFIKDRKDFTTLYRVANGEIDFNFLNDFLKSLE